MKIGFIGVGGVAQPHLKNLAALPDVSIGAVCDIDAGRAQATSSTFNAASYGDYHEMLKNETLDACYVCVLPSAHGAIELDLARAGIPFYAEKPVHLDLDACQKVVDELDRSGLVNSVGYHWRYTAPIQAMKKFVDAHQISVINGAYNGNLPGTPWWRQMKHSGGQLVEQTTHIVDLARHLGGEVHTVYAAGTTGAMRDVENYDIYDASIVTLSFDSGAIGQISSSCIVENNIGWQTDIVVKGRGWQAGGTANLVRLQDGDGTQEVEGREDWAEQLGLGDKAFVQAVRDNDNSLIRSSYKSGAQTLAITLAANQSMQSGASVQVRRFV